jgi:hypothetical protein
MANDDYTAPTTRATGYVVTAATWNDELVDNFTAMQLAVKGDGSADTDVIHAHKSGTWASRPAAGTARRIYYCTDTGWTIMDDGTLWSVISHNPKLSDHLYEDFHAVGTATLTADGFFSNWRFTETGAAELAHGSGFAHSYARLTAKTTTGNCGHLSPIGTNQPYIDAVSSRCYPMICEMGVRLDSSIDVTSHFGLFDAMSTAQAAQPNSSIMFSFGRSGDADLTQFFTVTRDNGGGETTNDSGVTPTHSNIDIVRFEVDSTSACRFYVNGSLVSTHAAGIPVSEKLHPGFTIRTNANSDKTLSVDYMDLYYKRYI